MSRKHWDRGAFWFPTRDRRGVFFLFFMVLFILHFDELFGIHTMDTVLFGAFPSHYVYHFIKSLVHVVFLYLLYLHWPEPPAVVTDGDGA